MATNGEIVAVTRGTGHRGNTGTRRPGVAAETPNSNLQITNKDKTPSSNQSRHASRLKFGICDLFEIWGFRIGICRLALILAMLLGGTAAAQVPRPQRPRDMLQSGIEAYKRDDYESAAVLFAKARIGADELDAAERADLDRFGKQNTSALKSRQEGSTQIHQAEEALAQGRAADASKLVNAVMTNPHLAPADRQALASLTARLQTSKTPGVTTDAKGLLAAARAALKAGDYKGAELLAQQAEKSGAGTSWLQPWADTPAKVRHDIAAARAKAAPSTTVKGPAVTAGAGAQGSGVKGQESGFKSPYTVASPPSTTQGPPLLPPPPVVKAGTADARELARQMLANGYKALQAGDLETARQLALRARDVNVDLGAKELGPDQLLAEVQKASAKAAATAKTPADSRALVKEGRAMLGQHKLEDAERLCKQAAAVPNVHWGLFEDTPQKLHDDITKARGERDRTESGKLLIEARKLFAKGDVEEAKRKAYQAQQLHGPYSSFDFGDRPQKLLAEIAKVEAKNAQPTQIAEKKGPKGPETAKGPDTAKAGAEAAARAAAQALLAEARELDRRGQLVEARQKALEASKYGLAFPPDQSPEALLASLAGKSRLQISETLKQVETSVASKAGDPARLAKAMSDLAAARQLAVTFAIDPYQVDQKAAWVQQAALSTRLPTSPSVPAPLDPGLAQAAHKAPAGSNSTGVVPVAATLPSPVVAAQPSPVGAMLPSPVSPGLPIANALDAKKLAGLDKLTKARMELKAGNCAAARRLAEEAYDPVFGVQSEAATVLRDVDAEEHAQRQLTAKKTFDAAMDAYYHGNFKQASAIFAGVEYSLLSPAQQERVREIMSTREMQPDAVIQAGAKQLLKPATNDPPGTAVAGSGPSLDKDDPLEHVKAMEKIQFQQMYERNLQAQKSALELFKAGQEVKAVGVLTDQLSQVELLQLAPEPTRQLRAPLEKRLAEFRKFMADKVITNAKSELNQSLFAGEEKREKKLRETQKEVADLVKQAAQLQKDGKYKDALAMARKANQLDPENQAVTALIGANEVLYRQTQYDDDKKQKSEMFLDLMRDGPGKLPTEDEPITMSASGAQRLGARNTVEKIESQFKNPKERAIEKRLDLPIHYDFKDMPLSDVIENISKLSNVPIYADKAALREANISLDSPLSMHSPNLSMKSALNIMLKEMRLTYVIREESLIITTADKLNQQLKRVVYPIADLITPVENHELPDVFDLQKVLEKHWQSQYAIGGTPPTPLQSPTSLPPAPAVSSYNSGLGSAFGAMSGSQPQAMGYSPVQPHKKGETLEHVLMDLIKGTIAPNSWKEMGGPANIQYYPLGMALVVTQVQEVQGEVYDLLAALRRLLDMEIAIEMRLVSVSESFYERIGVDFDVNLNTPISPSNQQQLLTGNFTPFGTVNKNLSFNHAVVGLTPAGTLTPDLNFPIKNSSFAFSTPPFGGYTAPGLDGGLSLGLAFLSEIQVFMVLEAAQADSRTNIMQAPKITVFNGQTAFITIGTAQFVNLGSTAFSIGGQIVYIPNNVPLPINIGLRVTPVVSADRRFVRMNLAPSLTNLIGNNIVPTSSVQTFPGTVQQSIGVPVPPGAGPFAPSPLQGVVQGPLGVPINAPGAFGTPTIVNSFTNLPIISTIALNTTVNVPDGGTVVLGGLKTMSEGRNEAGPPILSKIPYLNRLFRNVGWGRDGQTLMIMVTPRIIINEEEEQIFMGQLAPIPRQ